MSNACFGSRLVLVFVLFLALISKLGSYDLVGAEEGKHLFILSGQSNMQGHRPEEAFAPAVQAAFGAANVLIVQDAHGGQPILRWWRNWRSPEGEKPEKTGDLYDRLMSEVRSAIEGQSLLSVTLIWMQGERDARMKWGSVYEAGLKGLYAQLSKDLDREDINFVNGRLSDFDLENEKYAHWSMIRDIQVSLANSNDRFAWVNTDDLNDGLNRQGKPISNDLHYSAEGYKIFGKRIADAAVNLIREHSK